MSDQKVKSSDLMGFRGIHYNGIKLIDFDYKCSENNEIFLDYLSLFTSKFIIPTKTANLSKLPFYNLIWDNFQVFTKNNFYYNSEFNDKDLKTLFNIIYKVNAPEHKISNCFQNNDNITQDLFSKKLEELDSEHFNNNINIPVCALLKYLEHHSGIQSDIFKGGENYGLKDLEISHSVSDNLHLDIDISKFIKYSEDLREFTRVLKYILLVTKMLNIIISTNMNLLTSTKENQSEFLEKLLEFNDGISPPKVKNKSKISFSGFLRYNLRDIVQRLYVYSESDIDVLKTGYKIKLELNDFLVGNFDIIIFQLDKCVKTLETIKIRRYKNMGIGNKIRYYIHDLAFSAMHYLKLYVIFIKCI